MLVGASMAGGPMPSGDEIRDALYRRHEVGTPEMSRARMLSVMRRTPPRAARRSGGGNV